MLRRGFLTNIFALSTLLSLPLLSFFRNKKIVGILIEDQHLNYLTDMSSFNEIVDVLKEQNISATLRTSTSPAKATFNVLNLVALNSSYGRFSNFDIDQFKLNVRQQPSEGGKLLIKTAGPSGYRLSKSTNWPVIGKHLSETVEPVYFVNEALPHFFNSQVFNKLKPTGTYFIDATTRKTVYLILQLDISEKINPKILAKLNLLQDALQKDFNGFETRAIAFLKTKMKVRPFGDLLSMTRHEAQSKGLSLKA